MEGTKDPSLDVEKQTHHLERPGFRIAELTINPTQKVPWHCHSNVQDTFYVLEGKIRLFLRDPKEEIRLAPGETYSVKPRRPTWLSTALKLLRPSWFCRVSVNTTSSHSDRYGTPPFRPTTLTPQNCFSRSN
jgi:hypothetical protein